jgi:hypothetical protein
MERVMGGSAVGLVDRLRSDRRFQDRALLVFLVVVLAHWAEHLLQAFQIWALEMPPERALGGLGLLAPDLVRSEWLHWIYNVLVLIGLAVLLPAFSGTARSWWTAALVVQGWHFVEHGLLLGQALTGNNLFGAEVPTSVLQLVFPRVELHLAYNGIVTALLLVGYIERRRAPASTGVLRTA